MYQRKPSPAPTSAPQNTVSSAAGEKRTNSRYSAKMACPVTYASAVNAAAAMVKVLIARPSSPSVRLTAFEENTSTSTANGTYSHPRSGVNCLKKGKINSVL